MNVAARKLPAPVETDPEWYKDAIIYQLHVKAFADSNEDGIGDFAGLTERLDYLQDLGVTTVWLLPFYPSPGRDDGYDIADYGRINPDFGTMKDFRRFMAEAKRRGLRVITELVINHTSDQHAWFKRARRSPPGSSARNWYVWSDTDQKFLETRIIFVDTEKSNWAWDPEAGAYYWHRFFSHQPDLNFDNPRVISAVIQVMKRWLDMGVDGFRLDAIPYLIERDGTNNENLPETHVVIKKLRAALDEYAQGKLLLAEANQWPEDVSAYFGDGDECHMAYHFPLMPRIYMAIAQEDRFPITDILRQTPEIPANCQWAMFLRNHDELTLEMVTDRERDYLYSTYAADPRMRVNVGIRRRLAPLMDNDRRKIELMNSILMSMPGTPIIYYGDEIGMGDNIYLGDRNGVRTPMQWTPDRNGGFSRCDPAKLYLPPIMDPVYGYQAVNVEAQSRSLSSLLSWMKRIIAVRKSSQVFGRGTLTIIRPSNRAVLTYVRELGDEAVLCVANLSRSAQAVKLDLEQFRGRVPMEMLGRSKFPRIGEAPFVVTLAPYGFFWFRLDKEDSDEDDGSGSQPEPVTLVFADGWRSLTAGRSRTFFERDVLPSFMQGRRWFAGKAANQLEWRMDNVIQPTGEPDLAIAIAGVTADGTEDRYVLPLMTQWEERNGPTLPSGPNVLARVRRTARAGILVDASAETSFAAWLMRNLHAGKTLDANGQRLDFQPTETFSAMDAPTVETVKAAGVEQSNSTVLIDGNFVAKVFRRLQPGINPELEIGRFLTDVAKFPNVPPLMGAVELVDGDTRYAVAAIHGLIENQGDGWALSRGFVDRFLEEAALLATEVLSESQSVAGYLPRMRQLGRRLGELHVAFASHPEDPVFAPEPITPADVQAWTDRLLGSLRTTWADLRRRRDTAPERVRPLIDELLARESRIAKRIGAMLQGVDAIKIRHHGDFHLGQVLIVKDDVFILDFEGEPQRSTEERRQKAPAARDVAGLIRSIDYAATSSLDTITAGGEDRSKLDAAVDWWRAQCVEGFLQSYREAVTAEGVWPPDEEQSRALLEFFVLEKAIYEIGYEIANRPNWIGVPLAGTWRVLFPDERIPG